MRGTEECEEGALVVLVDGVANPGALVVEKSLSLWGGVQLLRRNVKRFRGGLVFKAHRLLYHSTVGLRVIKKEKKYRGERGRGAGCGPRWRWPPRGSSGRTGTPAPRPGPAKKKT